MTAWEIIDATFKASGLPDAETVYQAHWHDCAKSFEEMHFLNGFGHADKRFHFRADWAACGRDFADMPALPGHNAGYNQAEIGRASCRERVSRYGYNSVVAVSLKKKTTQTS